MAQVAPNGIGFRAEYLAELTVAEDHVVRLADAIPSEKYTWRPADGVRSVSEVLLHIASSNFNLPRVLGEAARESMIGPEYDTSTTDKATVLRSLRESFDFLRAGIETTIGRALAHRKTKFCLIDGTVISGTPEFYGRISSRVRGREAERAPHHLYRRQRVIFESGQETALYRYLPTMVDGLESTSAGRVCLMMTTMDVGNLPPALVRSGRIELWLETRLHDEPARLAIPVDRSADLPASIGAVEPQQLAAASEGLSGADPKRVVADGKLLVVFERLRKARTEPATTYFFRGIETVRRNKAQYAKTEARARARHRCGRLTLTRSAGPARSRMSPLSSRQSGQCPRIASRTSDRPR